MFFLLLKNCGFFSVSGRCPAYGFVILTTKHSEDTAVPVEKNIRLLLSMEILKNKCPETHIHITVQFINDVVRTSNKTDRCCTGQYLGLAERFPAPLAF